MEKFNVFERLKRITKSKLLNDNTNNEINTCNLSILNKINKHSHSKVSIMNIIDIFVYRTKPKLVPSSKVNVEGWWSINMCIYLCTCPWSRKLIHLASASNIYSNVRAVGGWSLGGAYDQLVGKITWNCIKKVIWNLYGSMPSHPYF